MNIFESIKKEFTIPNAYGNWKVYRRELTDLIIQDAKKSRTAGKSCGSLAVLGAGPCNDLDLQRLISHFGSIDLIDVDVDSVKEGLINQGQEHCPSIHIKKASLTGVEQELTERFFNRLYMYLVEKGRSVTETDFIERSIMEFKLVEQDMFKTSDDFTHILPEKSYDMVVAAGLHSQLWSILSYSWHILSGNVSEQILGGRTIDPEPFHDHIREVDDKFIPVMNEAILGSAKERVLFSSEYDPNYPSEGAWQCIKDVRQRYTRGDIELDESTLEWPFYPEQRRKYTMLIQDIKMC
ncbi:hypothetical protein UYO_0631 [Lachnospiraceae bacterium JC7]|nr:hypothetical protein UYO_0631 [Lachnospiraceae bacterium JC7]